jgi:Ser/Thr protein kinase RdoA (MazF antagonist)
MMPLTEIDRLKRTVTSAWESPVADQVAAAWGYPAGTAKWWRSSASHVFVLLDPRGKRYLRFVPDAYRAAGAVVPVSVLMHRLAAGGAAVVSPVPTGAGSLTTTVPTALGTMHAMVVEAAEIPARFAEDPALVKATARLVDRLVRLPRDRSRFGAVHGDFELDNLAWDAGRATAFDFDEAAQSWYAADIAYALRDLTGADGESDPTRRHLVHAFVAGYRGVRPLDDSELANLRLFAGAHAACSAVRIAHALDSSGADEPAWRAELRADLTVMARAQRDLAVAVAERD